MLVLAPEVVPNAEALEEADLLLTVSVAR